MYSLCPYCGGSGEFWKFNDEGDRISDSCTACEGAGHIPKSWYDDYMEHQKPLDDQGSPSADLMNRISRMEK